ncbi:MAG: hypothetical protein AAF828_03500 [Bacteroidota bacterium]
MKTYQPISCDFYDVLEANAVRRIKSVVVYQAEDEVQTVSDVIITDLQTRNKEEFVYLSNGLELRLDQLISVNGLVPGQQCVLP